MLRVKSPFVTVPFYRDYFGMTLVREVSDVLVNFCVCLGGRHLLIKIRVVTVSGYLVKYVFVFYSFICIYLHGCLFTC